MANNVQYTINNLNISDIISEQHEDFFRIFYEVFIDKQQELNLNNLKKFYTTILSSNVIDISIKYNNESINKQYIPEDGYYYLFISNIKKELHNYNITNSVNISKWCENKLSILEMFGRYHVNNPNIKYGFKKIIKSKQLNVINFMLSMPNNIDEIDQKTSSSILIETINHLNTDPFKDIIGKIITLSKIISQKQPGYINPTLYAIYKNNNVFLKEMINLGAVSISENLDHRNIQYNVLTTTIQNNNIPFLEYLLDISNKKTNEHILLQALSMAVDLNNKIMAIMIYEKISNIIDPSKLENSLLAMSSKHKDCELFFYFINKGMNPLENDNFNESILMKAVKNNNVKIVQYLLNINAINPTQKESIHNCNIFHVLSSTCKNKQIINLIFGWFTTKLERNILKRIVNEEKKGYETPLTIAAQNNNKVMLKKLITAGANVNFYSSINGCSCKRHYSALAYAVEYDNLDCAKILLEHKANVNCYLINQFRCNLMFLVKSVAMIKLLILYKININKKNSLDWNSYDFIYSNDKELSTKLHNIIEQKNLSSFIKNTNKKQKRHRI